MFFFGKKKKLLKQNRESKEEIINFIASISNVKSAKIAGMLNDIKSMLEQQNDCDMQEGIDALAKVKKVLMDVNKYIAAGQVGPAENRLDKAKSFVVERSGYCTIGAQRKGKKQTSGLSTKNVVIEESHAEDLELRISKAVEEQNRCIRAYKEWQARLQRNPNDREALANLKVAELNLKKSEKDIQMLEDELGRETLGKMMKDMNIMRESLVGERTVSDEELEIETERYQQNEEKAQEDKEKINKVEDLMFGSGSAAGKASSFDLDSFLSSRGNSSMSTGTGAGSAYGSASSSAYGGARSSAYGSSAGGNSVGSLQQQIAEIKQAQAGLEKSMDAYNDKLDEAGEQLRELNNQLKPLLMKRRNASPSDCLLLDGQIDQLNAKRNGVQNAIKRYRQVLAQLSEQQALMDKFEVQKDLESTEAHLRQITGGKFQDFESMAMYLKKSIKESNEKLEDIGAANAVADSEEINVNTYSGANATYTERTDAKDEDKYAALEADLGMVSY